MNLAPPVPMSLPFSLSWVTEGFHQVAFLALGTRWRLSLPCFASQFCSHDFCCVGVPSRGPVSAMNGICVTCHGTLSYRGVNTVRSCLPGLPLCPPPVLTSSTSCFDVYLPCLPQAVFRRALVQSPSDGRRPPPPPSPVLMWLALADLCPVPD